MKTLILRFFKYQVRRGSPPPVEFKFRRLDDWVILSVTPEGNQKTHDYRIPLSELQKLVGWVNTNGS